MLFLKNIFFLFSGLLLFNSSNIHKVKYQIESSSKMCLKIATNVNTINCNCEDKFYNEFHFAELDATNSILTFTKTFLKINVKTINCKNYLLNKDLHKSLDAEKFPTITFELQSLLPTHLEKEIKLDKDYTYTAKTFITIAGKTHPQQIKVYVRKCDNETYQLRANKDISMAEYCIQPKSPFSFIKINDIVNIQLDLSVKTIN